MLLAERRSIAQRVSAHLAIASPELGAFATQIGARVTAALTAIDAAAAAADAPLLVAELLPAIDVLVARDFNRAAPATAVDAPDLESIWENDPVSNDWLDALIEHISGLVQRQGAGAYHHQGEDGMHYFVFDSKYRSEALRQIGIEDGDVLTISPLAVEA